jgi:hypothetical protein
MRCLKTVALILAAPLGALAQSNQCALGDSSPSLSAFWSEFRMALEIRHPTEVQKLVDIRLKLDDLRTAKMRLISKIKIIRDVGSTPDWLQARVNDIPKLQGQIQDAMSAIDRDARDGGLLAGDPQLTKVRNILNSRKLETLCELSRIPFPLSQDQFKNLENLLSRLEEEAQALVAVDNALGQLIWQAQRR